MKNNKNIRYLSVALATVAREICEKLYAESIYKVYNYANKTGMLYNPCLPCEVDTPTISDVNESTCALCGSRKNIEVLEPVKVTQN